MTILDVVVLLALGFFLMRGLKEGMLARAATVLGFFAALLVVRNYYDDLQAVIIGLPGKTYLTAIIGVVVLSAVFTYAFKLADKSLDVAKMIPGLGSFNKIGGAVIGALEGVVIISMLVYGAYVVWGQGNVEGWLAGGVIAKLFTHSTNFIVPIVNYMLDIV